MKITKDVVLKLDPCKGRLDNYLKFYGNKELTPNQFMGLKNITQADKLWVAFRLMPKDNIRLAAAGIAESVLHIFENAYPNDKTPRLAIEEARSGTKEEGRAIAAARDYDYSANASVNAAYAANAANAANASVNAANASVNAYKSITCRANQEKLVRKICLKYWRMNNGS